MNIGIVTTWFERGAAYVSRQFRDVLCVDNNVFIYARGGESFAVGDPAWDFDYVTWARNPDSSASTDIHAGDFVSWLKDNQIEVVIFNEQTIWEPVITCRDLGVKTGAYIDYYTEEMVPQFGCYDFLICNTKKHYSVFDWHEQALYIPWGTNVSLFSPRRKNGKVNEDLVLFHSAGMSPYRKGTDLVLEAFDNICMDGVKLLIHSQVDLIESFPDKKKLIDSLRSKGRLEVVQKTIPAPGIFHMADVYVYPTRLEGIGLTIIEAASSGLPVIVPDNGPMNEFIAHGVNGRLVGVDKFWSRSDGYYWPLCEVSVDSLREEMEFFILNSKDIGVFQNEARLHAEENFDWEKNSKAIVDAVTSSKILQGSKLDLAINRGRKMDQIQREKHPKPKKDMAIDFIKQHFPFAIYMARKLRKL